MKIPKTFCSVSSKNLNRKLCNFSENKGPCIKILQRQKLIKFSSQVAVKTFKLLLQTSQSKLEKRRKDKMEKENKN